MRINPSFVWLSASISLCLYTHSLNLSIYNLSCNDLTLSSILCGKTGLFGKRLTHISNRDPLNLNPLVTSDNSNGVKVPLWKKDDDKIAELATQYGPAKSG